MYFLGAIIGGNTIEEARSIAAPYAVMEMPEHIVETCDKFLEFNRRIDRIRLENGLRNSKNAAKRLKMNDMDAAKAYAKPKGFKLDEDGNVLGTYNENAFYEWLEFDANLPEGMERVQGATCRELLERCKGDDTRGFMGGLHAVMVVSFADDRDGAAARARRHIR